MREREFQTAGALTLKALADNANETTVSWEWTKPHDEGPR